MIVDTHAHVVAEDQERYPRQIAPTAIANWISDSPVSAEEMLRQMDQAGIDRTVLVQAYSAYRFDSGYVVDSATRYPGRFTSVCSVDMMQPEAPALLSHWVQRGGRGLRVFASLPVESDWLDDPNTFGVWEMAESLGIPVCVAMVFNQIPRLSAVLRRFPGVTLAVDHLAGPSLREGPPYRGAKPLFDLAEFPNLYLKFSTVNLDAASQGRSTPRELFSRLVDHFGARRLMWGSNFPATYDRTLSDQLALAKRALAFLSQEDQRWMLGDTALTLWPELRA